jgi:hypothetical protein
VTVQAFISRQGGREREFEWYHERRAAIDLVKAMWSAFHALDSFYAVVVNVDQPPADALILTQSGLGVLEFKHYGGRLQGQRNGTWYASGEDGRVVEIRAGLHHRNPYHQVRAYTKKLQELIDVAWQQSVDLPEWLSDARMQGGVWFTRPARWEDRPVVPGRFRVFTELAEIPEWAATLAFGGVRRRLTVAQIKTLATRVLNTQVWAEIEPMMPTGAPYGCLYIQEPRGTARVVLDHDEMCIGRAPECGPLAVDGEAHPLVSWRHAGIRREGQETVIYDGYQGEPSRNGTYVNGLRISTTEGCELRSEDVIVLGAFSDPEHTRPARGSCEMIFRTMSFSVERSPTLPMGPTPRRPKRDLS